MNKLKIFENEEFGKVRTAEVNGEPWLVLKDVCDALGLTNPTIVMQRLDEEEVTKLNLGSRTGIVNLINESGLYAVVLRSDKPSAKKFRKWVTSEVLPSIRKTGTYQQAMTTSEQIKLLAKGNVELEQKIDSIDEDLQQFKQDLPLLGCDMDRITTAVKKMGVKCLGGKDSEAYHDKSIRQKVYTDIYEQIKRQFGVSTYKSIKRSECDTALQVVEYYQLPIVLKNEIEMLNAQESFS